MPSAISEARLEGSQETQAQPRAEVATQGREGDDVRSLRSDRRHAEWLGVDEVQNGVYLPARPRTGQNMEASGADERKATMIHLRISAEMLAAAKEIVEPTTLGTAYVFETLATELARAIVGQSACLNPAPEKSHGRNDHDRIETTPQAITQAATKDAGQVAAQGSGISGRDGQEPAGTIHGAEMTAKNWEAAYDKACRERDQVKAELANAQELIATMNHVDLERTSADEQPESPAGGAPMQTEPQSHGLYELSWKVGGTSLAAVGSDASGLRWFAPTNWVSVPSFDWSPVQSWKRVDTERPAGEAKCCPSCGSADLDDRGNCWKCLERANVQPPEAARPSAIVNEVQQNLDPMAVAEVLRKGRAFGKELAAKLIVPESERNLPIGAPGAAQPRADGGS
jgi:hypothetical protein